MSTAKTPQNKHIAGGCMAGFFNFSNLLTGKRFYLKRLPPPLPFSDVTENSTSELVGVPEVKEQSEKSPESEFRSPDPATLESAKGNVSPWKFVRESPRLSLDSRLCHRKNSAGDGDEGREDQRRSPCVIARLMGLEQTESSPEKNVGLRRSASESRSRDYRFLHNPSFLEERKSEVFRMAKSSPIPNPIQKQNHDNRKKGSYYNTADFFPPKQQQQGVSIYGEIDRRLLGSNNSKDLETLKNILEALQLKGLLRSTIATPPVSRRNREPPIVVISPAPVSPRRERNTRRSSTPPVRRKGGPLSVEQQRRSDWPVQSPKVARSDRSVNRGRRSTVEGNRGERLSRRDSESSFRTENEKRRGGSLLERCDKLLQSIAELQQPSPSPVSVLDSSYYKDDESSPSPVKKRSTDFKGFEDQLWSPQSPSSSSSSSSSSSYSDHHHHHGIDPSSLDDPDFIYISKLFKSSKYLPDEPHLYLLLEKQISKEENAEVSSLHRKIIFDTIAEILNRNQNFPPRKSMSLGQIWAEFQRIRELGPAQELIEVIIEVLKKDLGRDSVGGWRDCHVETSEAVLDIERLIFKDLIGESIGDLAAIAIAIAAKDMGAQKYRRKLVF